MSEINHFKDERAFRKDAIDSCKNCPSYNLSKNQSYFCIEKMDEIKSKINSKEQFIFKEEVKVNSFKSYTNSYKNYIIPDIIVFDKYTKELIALELKSEHNYSWFKEGKEQCRDYLSFADQSYIVLPYGAEITENRIEKCKEIDCGILRYPSKNKENNFMGLFDEIVPCNKNKNLSIKFKKEVLKYRFDLEEDIIKYVTEYDKLDELEKNIAQNNRDLDFITDLINDNKSFIKFIIKINKFSKKVDNILNEISQNKVVKKINNFYKALDRFEKTTYRIFLVYIPGLMDEFEEITRGSFEEFLIEEEKRWEKK